MKGSDKQIAWAEDIKAKFLRDVERHIPNEHPQADACKAALHEATDKHDDANWWIDNRGFSSLRKALDPDYQQALAKRIGRKQ